MAGYVYHLRPKSNARFCKVGMTHGRSVEKRLRELNTQGYGGFTDWEVVSSVLVDDPVEVERSIHKRFVRSGVPSEREQEFFYATLDEVECALEPFKKISLDKHVRELGKWQKKCAHLERQVAELEEQVRDLQGKHPLKELLRASTDEIQKRVRERIEADRLRARSVNQRSYQRNCEGCGRSISKKTGLGFYRQCPSCGRKAT
ncbi:GIY-YIG nuclease family protein [Ferrimonas marina]|uniref:T5orf172 domain-containing protein n=1 Tax=Ferrimonas marina TaxID=299255 RepID=A0A1M5X7U1_9GAMM|nr:T5orf172 domain-containing protein [Ferrimonas marina]